MGFNEYKGLNLVAVGDQMLEQWKKEDAFGQSLALREGAPAFIFFEGPPSANGKPGIHHVMARSIKDAICRYKTQTGYQVRRRAGWDTHGLPVELGVEKMLGITKADIGTKISVADYNAACRREVMKYTKEWVAMTERVGYWVDMQDPYITYDNRYIETLWYLLKDIYNKGLLYKGYTIQPYSPTDGTGLSSHELNQPGCYRDVSDTTATVQFEVIKDGTSQKLFDTETLPVYFLAWTTTPWTLPSNTALCVGPDIEYVRILSSNPYTGEPAIYVLAEKLVGTWFGGKVPFEQLPGKFRGSELAGIRYKQLIPWFKPQGDAFRVIEGDYVTTEDGTGIVHIAPTFGADDKRVAAAAGIVGIMPVDRDGNPQAQVDRQGRFCRLEDLDPAYVAENVDPSYAEFAGRYVKAGYRKYFEGVEEEGTLDIDLCVMMKADGRAFKVQKHVHSYPHSWRTDLPVLYYPLDSWFIRATAVKDAMVALNREIRWKPESTGSGRFGVWLENIQDWNLSRSRFWGTPLPIWRTEDGRQEKCIGSVAELFAEIDKAVAAGIMASNPLRDKGFDPADISLENYQRIDLHRPFVDEIFLVSDDGKKMVRESDLIDVWFDSGAMPYAQEGLRGLHTPGFGATADFIAEGVDQTRGWFYTLHAIHTMVSGTPAFRRVISNGLVLDKNGNKMSKRLGNAVDPFQEIEQFGSDALRWYMITNAQPWDNLKFDEEGVKDVTRKFFGTLHNTYKFFAQYANVDGFDNSAAQIAVAERPVMDRWILSELNSLTKEVRESLDDFEPTRAGRLITNFVNDYLSNWYVHLTRDRYWGSSMSADKLAAYQTLYSCLETVARLMSPIAPFYADRLYRDLTAVAQPGAPVSVHLADYPVCDESLVDKELETRMELAQKLTSMVLALRKRDDVKINVRKPLQKILIPVTAELRSHLEPVKDLVRDQVNVKEIEFVEGATDVLVKKVKCNFKILGKKFGPLMKGVAAAVQNMSQQDVAALEQNGSFTFDINGTPATVDTTEVEIYSEDIPGWVVANEGTLTVALDIQLTDELKREGIARELKKRIQDSRKQNGLEITDRIKVRLNSNAETDAAVREYEEWIKSQVLADSIELVPGMEQGEDISFDDYTFKLQINKN